MNKNLQISLSREVEGCLDGVGPTKTKVPHQCLRGLEAREGTDGEISIQIFIEPHFPISKMFDQCS